MLELGNNLPVSLPIYIQKQSYHQGPDFDDMSSFFPCEIDDPIQYIDLENSYFIVHFFVNLGCY